MDDIRPNNGHTETPRSGEFKLASIDHEEYDALADLFLGGGDLAPEPFVVEVTDIDEASELQSESLQDHQSEHLSDDEPDLQSGHQIVDEDFEAEELDLPNHDTHTPILQLTRHEDDAQLSASTPVMSVLETLDITDAHAAELLAELMSNEPAEDEFIETIEVESSVVASDRGDLEEPLMMPIPCVEVVVLGHLPVRASLWARQYACSRSRDCNETVALIRAASGSTAVDLISGGEPIRTRSYAHLQGALQAVSDFADRVIMRVDEGSEPELLERAEVDEITILTGADEAAVVASYRLVKTLDAALGERYTSEDEMGTGFDSAPTLRLAVMGASAEQASDACMKLENAVETFIERDVEIVVGSGRIDATGTTNLYRDLIAHPPCHIIVGLVEAARRDAREEDSIIEHADVDQMTEAPVQSSMNQKSSTMVEPKPLLGFASASTKRDREQAPKMNDGLCALIPGLSPIEARCPKASGVEMGIDSQGQLHLVVCDDDTIDAMNRLLAAQTWARNNFGLLVRAESGLAIPSADRNEETDAMMHLISTEPSNLVEIYDTQVRVYALARVRVGKVIAQVATPIN